MADNGVDLNQGATDTIRQAIGSQPIPRDGLPNPGPRHSESSDWSSLENAFRYGYGAGLHYHARDWSEELSAGLRKEWEAGRAEGAWDSVKHGVERGWYSARRAL